MELLPAIDEEKELLILDRTYVGNLNDAKFHFQITYCKDSSQFMLKEGILCSGTNYPKIKEIILNSDNTRLRIKTEFIICEPDAGQNILLVSASHLEVYNELVELHRNGWTHPLVDEFNIIGVFK